jgi:gamma-aminobutyric acid type B receptor
VDADVRTIPRVNECQTQYGIYFTGALYVVQGLMMCFGAFLAWETRKVHTNTRASVIAPYDCAYNNAHFLSHYNSILNPSIFNSIYSCDGGPFQVKMEALNDSKLIGVCIYNVLILSVLGTAIGFILDSDPDMSYGFRSGIVLVGVILTIVIMFVPKARFCCGRQNQYATDSSFCC